MKEAKNVFEELEVEIKLPRLCSRQTKGVTFSDYENLVPDDYWKRIIFISILMDHVISDLKARFGDKDLSVFSLNMLISNELKTVSGDLLVNGLKINNREFKVILVLRNSWEKSGYLKQRPH